MSILSAVAGIPGVNSLVSGGIRAVDDVTPFASPGAALAKNIASPSVNYLGNTNPSGSGSANSSNGQVLGDSTTTPSSGAYTDTSGGVNSTGTGYTGPDAAAYYTDQANQDQSQINNLDPLQAQLLANVNNSYNSSLLGLNDQNAVATRDYNTATQNTIANNESAKAGIDQSVASNTNALQRLLGTAGSGNSSAADYANYAAARQGTLQRQGVQDSYGQNRQALDTNYGDTQDQYQTGLNSLNDQKTTNTNGVLSSINSNRASLLQTLANLQIQAKQANGESYATAASAASPYVQQIQALNAQQAALTQNYANPVTNTTGVAFAAPSLASYSDPSTTAAPTTSNTANGVDDTVSPIYASLLKKDANGNIIA